MAYADYQDQTFNQGMAKLYPGASAGFNEAAYAMPRGPVQGSATSMLPGATSNGITAPDSNNMLPTNTRQQAVQNVQQAYATPARMPGDMGYLNGLLEQSSQAPTANDPLMRGAFAAGRVADQRNVDRQRAALAEQLGAYGIGDSGAMQTRTNAIQQRTGEQQALRESGMLYDEANARRNALLQGLGLDQSRYQGDNQLGYQLAALQAQLNQNAVAPFF